MAVDSLAPAGHGFFPGEHTRRRGLDRNIPKNTAIFFFTISLRWSKSRRGIEPQVRERANPFTHILLLSSRSHFLMEIPKPHATGTIVSGNHFRRACPARGRKWLSDEKGDQRRAAGRHSRCSTRSDLCQPGFGPARI